MWHVWGRTEFHTGFWWGSLKESDSLGDQGIGGKKIKLSLIEICWEGVEWIYLVQDRDKWRAVVNAVMHLFGS
jgi:hypothetical protein